MTDALLLPGACKPAARRLRRPPTRLHQDSAGVDGGRWLAQQRPRKSRCDSSERRGTTAPGPAEEPASCCEDRLVCDAEAVEMRRDGRVGSARAGEDVLCLRSEDHSQATFRQALRRCHCHGAGTQTASQAVCPRMSQVPSALGALWRKTQTHQGTSDLLGVRKTNADIDTD